jgi:short-subunit dehydrogenase
MFDKKTTKKLTRRARRASGIARTIGNSVLIGAGIGVGLGTAAYFARRRNRIDLAGRVVVIMGGSRGLGLALAEECAKQGAAVAICARDGDELDAAKQQIESRFGGDVFTGVCDVSNDDEVGEFLTGVLSRFGQVDVLINNAGIISVGPAESQTLTDYQEAMDIMYWGVVYPTLNLLPHMKARRSGRIVNITSIGGKIAMPHLLPYDAAKFAAVGFSEGMRAELAKDGIKVTTICPGLMRTGSHLNAYFKGQNRKEFTWFSFGATLPLVSIDARRAARKIVDALRAGEAEVILTPQAKLAAAFHGLFPGLTADLLGIANRLMPSPAEKRKDRHRGEDSETFVTRSFVQRLGRKAARELNQKSGRVNGRSLADMTLPTPNSGKVFP